MTKKGGFRISTGHLIKGYPKAFDSMSSARTFQDIDHLQPLRHLTASRILALRVRLAVVLLLSQE